MLIDYVTLKLRYEDCPHWGGWRRLSSWGDRFCKICGRTGEVVWERNTWESLRSDSYQIAVYCSGSSLQIAGSPARVMGDGLSLIHISEPTRPY